MNSNPAPESTPPVTPPAPAPASSGCADTAGQPRSRLAAIASLALLFVAAFGAMLLLDLTLTAFVPGFENFSPYYYHGILRWGLFWLLVVALTALAWRAGARRPIWGAAGLLLLAPVFAYLATDDEKLESVVSLQELSAPFPGAAAGHALVLRYARGTPVGDAYKEPVGMPQKWPKPDSPEWTAFLRDNQTSPTAAWAEIAPVRDWWKEWSELPQVGDMTTSYFDSVPGFKPIKNYSALACSEASRLALTQQGEAAIACLLPVLEGGQKLDAHARTQVRQMIALVVQRQALQTAVFVLATTEVPPEMRARLEVVLAKADGGPAGVRRLTMMDYILFTTSFDTFGKVRENLNRGPFGPWLDLVWFNQNRTYNHMSAAYREAAELAARRDAKGAKLRLERYKDEGAGRTGIKNVMRGLLAQKFVPDLKGVINNYWEVQDRRAAVLATLRGEAGTALPTKTLEAGK
jgi:hypothetical protein